MYIKSLFLTKSLTSVVLRLIISFACFAVVDIELSFNSSIVFLLSMPEVNRPSIDIVPLLTSCILDFG